MTHNPNAQASEVTQAIEKYGEPNERGHVTRYSDSSLYDEKCVLCGMVDGSLMWPMKENIYNTDCPVNTRLASQASTDRPTGELVECLEGPHEWGYHDPVVGGFIADNAPYEAATHITALEAKIAGLQAAMRWFAKNAEGLKDDIRLAHRSRGNGCTEWMSEDDRDFRKELDEQLATLTTLLSDAPDNRGEGEQS